MGSCLCSRLKPGDTSIIQNTTHRRSSFLSSNQSLSSLPHIELSIDSKTSDIDIKISGSDSISFNNDILTSLGIDNLRNIATFLSITDYAFSFLQINKAFNDLLSPYKSPYIMEQLIQTNSTRNFDHLGQHEPKWKSFISNLNMNNRLEEFQIMGTLAWQNHAKIEYENITQILDVIDKKKLKRKSLYSSLYVLHFMYKCRYGDIKDTEQLKEILFRLICNGGGLGLGHMIIFYYEQTFGVD